MNLLDRLFQRPVVRDLVSHRMVPVQPAGGDPGKVYVGHDLGWVDFTGPRPRPGDLVIITGSAGHFVVRSSMPTTPSRQPTFNESTCKCKCPPSTTGGLIFYQSNLILTPLLLAIDGADGTIRYRSLIPEALNAEGVAVDPNPPHTMYILDNRSTYQDMETDSTPLEGNNRIVQTASKHYYTLLTYALSGNSFSFSGATVLPGGDFVNGHDGEPLTDIGNPLSVVNGTLWITRAGTPARLFTWNGTGFGEVTLISNSQPLETELVGQVVTVPDRPANRHALFIASRFGEIIQFNPAGDVAKVLTIEGEPDLGGLVVVCNRLIAIGRKSSTRREFQGHIESVGGGGGEEEV